MKFLERSNYLRAFEYWEKNKVENKGDTIKLLSDFHDFRSGGSYLIDKTHLLPDLVQQGRVIFRRPRRFGKSLTLSQLKYFFYGCTGLFYGLNIYHSDIQYGKFRWCPSNPDNHYFPPCPVIHLDFSKYSSVDETFANFLIQELKSEAKEAGLVDFKVEDNHTPNHVLNNLLKELSSDEMNKWKKVVILIDECDSPINSVKSENEKSKNIESLTNFLKTIKALDTNLVFCFLTGIETQIIYTMQSGANNFRDITFDGRFEDLCGSNENDLKKILEHFNIKPTEDQMKLIKENYNGYSFSFEKDSEKKRNTIYNNFFLGQYVTTKVLDDYWLKTFSFNIFNNIKGITFQKNVKLDKNFLQQPLSLNQPRDTFSVAHILFNFGYLTIKKVDDDGIVELAPPNKQIDQLLLSDYVTNILKFNINSERFTTAKENIMKGEIDAILKYQNELITALPFHQVNQFF